MLVAYSDSEDEDAEPTSSVAPAPAVAAPAPPPTALIAAAGPLAKKQRKEINLQALLQKHDVDLPFEDAVKLPVDFFDSGPVREPDASDDVTPRIGGGWSALSAMLPPPKNASKAGAKSVSSLYANAKPLAKKAAGVPSAPPSGPAASPAAGPSVGPGVGSGGGSGSGSGSAQAGPAPCLAVAAAAAMGEPDEMDDGMPAAPAPLLRPRLNTSMYDVAPPAADPYTAAAGPALPGGAPDGALPYDVPAGPAFGPPTDDGVAVEGYDEVAAGYGGYDLSEGRVLDIDQAAMAKMVGQARQYDFNVPSAPQEVKVSAGFWSRTSGEVVQHYQPSSLQKRKHQINSLAAQAKAAAGDISKRSSSSMKSKKETAAKYGW